MMRRTWPFSLLLVLSGHPAMAIEEPAYDVLLETKYYELRRYQPYIVAEVDVDENFKRAGNSAFRVLATPAMGAASPNPIVPPRRTRAYISFSSPSMNMVALSAKGVTGAVKKLSKAAISKTGTNALSKGNTKSVATPAKMARPIMGRCRRALSASPVQSGALKSVMRGVMPVSRPICAPVNPSP